MKLIAYCLAFSCSLLLAPIASAQIYFANLTGIAEEPPNASPGTGFAQVTIDLVAHTLQVQANFSDLVGTTTAAHVHAPTPTPFTGTAGVATQLPSFSGFPLGVTSGNYDMTFDMTLTSTWNPAYITANGGTTAGAEAAFAQALEEGRAYFNIHTGDFPGGEIRGFLVVPEPGSMVLFSLGAGLLFATRARRG